jgi:hypothetical protein
VSGPPPLPSPPAALPAIVPSPWTTDLWRIQNGTEIVARMYPAPRYRFDAPNGEYPVLYACASQIGTFAEVYGDRARRIGENEGGHYLIRIVPTIPLALIDLCNVQLLASLGLDERISVGDDYAICQAWARAFWQRFPEIAGIRYRARKAGATEANVALFLDRCLENIAVPAEDAQMLRDLEAIVLTAADVYNLVAKIPFA